MSPLKRLERYFSAFFKLGNTAQQAKSASRTLASIEPRLGALGDDLLGVSEGVTEVQGEIEALSERLERRMDELSEHLERKAEAGHLEQSLAALRAEQALLSRSYSDLARRLDLLRYTNGAETHTTPPGPPPERREGLDALLDAFYNRLEDRYRGAREDIRERLRVYLGEVQRAVEASGKPVFDLGCGRGEWVELLTREGIAASGIDLNPVQIADAQALGLDVREGDALEALAQAPDGAYAAITAHHLIEHLPFDTVAWMSREALRVLAPGGLLLYETPNPRNLIVGATTFHIDPTHRKPLPAEAMTTLLDTIGFHPVETRTLHPYEAETLVVAEGRLDKDVAHLLFGPQDLSILAHKPRSA
ncbi:MAG: methyltransferase domain-containing protein [Pseudomonadota bacterium]